MEESVSKRSRIQDAAVALFHEQGVEATSVNEISGVQMSQKGRSMYIIRIRRN